MLKRSFPNNHARRMQRVVTCTNTVWPGGIRLCVGGTRQIDARWSDADIRRIDL